jgi:hypothetical protein
MDGIDVQPGPGPVNAIGDLADRVDRPDRIGCPADGHEPGAVGQDCVERIEAQRAVGEVRFPGPDDRLVVASGRDPGIDVRLVVEAGHHDLVAGSQRRADGARDVEGERRHVRADRDVGAVHAEEVAESRMGIADDGLGSPGGQECTASIRVRLAVVAGDCIDHRLRDLRPARAVEEGQRRAVLGQRQGREAGAYRVDVEGGRHPGDASGSGGGRCDAR